MKKVHLVTEKTLKEFAKDNAVLRSAADHWLRTLKKARWSSLNDIKKDFVAADFLGNGSMRVIFDLAGNRFRMICNYHFGSKVVNLYICWIGTHKNYDEICKRGLQYTISDY